MKQTNIYSVITKGRQGIEQYMMRFTQLKSLLSIPDKFPLTERYSLSLRGLMSAVAKVTPLHPSPLVYCLQV